MLIHADNFNIYGPTPNDMTDAGRYSQANACEISTDPDGETVTKCLAFAGNGGLRRALQVPTGKIGQCARFWPDTLPGNNAQRPWLFRWADADNNAMARVLLNTTGAMQFDIFDVNSGAFGDWYTIHTTPGPVITAGAWWHVAAQFDAAGGSFKLQVEGREKINSPSSEWGGHLHNGPTIYQCGMVSAADGIGASPRLYVKDLVWWDGLGARNNNFLGSVIVVQSDPEEDVTIGGWVPSVGADAWSILDNNPANAPYVSADNTPPAPMELVLTDLPPDITTVRGVITIVRGAKVDGGDGNLQISLLSDGDVSAGDDRPITASQTDWEDVHEVDPNTGDAWTPAAYNAATIRIDRTL